MARWPSVGHLPWRLSSANTTSSPLVSTMSGNPVSLLMLNRVW